ncbi:LamG-like jellyroll fold domain-containing protein [Aeoliella sp.]|uniref:LamG-like jellyroll fold domain-containing protein n=1 Tax=Aeoliella sp. TaxID=2795800 RepID=UPI003CCBB6FD
MSEPEHTPRMEEVVERMADEPLSTNELRRLEQLIVEDPSTRKAYVKMAWLCGDLAWLFRDRAASLPSAAQRQEITPIPQARQRRSFYPLVSAVASAIAASLLLYLAGWLHFPGGEAGPGTVASSEDSRRTSDALPTLAATLTGLSDCRWAKGVPAPTYGEPLEEGRVLKLDSGIAKLTFESGAQLILQGPVEFVVESPMDCAMPFGKLSAVCPVQAHGFSVSTPTARVVDLGTEFGMEVDSEGDTEVHVFEGEVLTWPVDTDGNTTDEALSLVKDEAARFKKGLAREQDFAEANRFVRDISAHLDKDSLPPLPADRRLQLWLAADVLVKRDGANRVVAWRDILVGDNQSDEDAWQHDEDSRPLWVDKAINDKPALRFDGMKSYLSTTPFLTTPKQTVFVVFQRHEAPLAKVEKRQILNYNGPPFDLPKTMRAFRILQIDDMDNPGKYRAYIYAGLEQQGVYAHLGEVRMKQAAENNDPVVLAYVYDPEKNHAELWTNGQSQGSSNAPTGESFTSRKIIGRHPLHGSCFRGDIAELLIYNEALAKEDVAKVSTYLGGKYGISVQQADDSIQDSPTSN